MDSVFDALYYGAMQAQRKREKKEGLPRKTAKKILAFGGKVERDLRVQFFRSRNR
jgi:hypothetical protein